VFALTALPLSSGDGWVQRETVGLFWSTQLVSFVIAPVVAGLAFYYEVGPLFPGVPQLLQGFAGALLLLALGVINQRFLLVFIEPTKIRASSVGVELQLPRFTIGTSRFLVPWANFDTPPHLGRPRTVFLTIRHPVYRRQMNVLFSAGQYQAMFANPSHPPAWTELGVP
jgi:hypothetical protein